MTYCAGWKYKNSVFLIADTAATKPMKPQTSHSSDGQLHAEVRGEYVEESLLKLVPLANGTVAALAGDVGMATSCLDFLRDNFSATLALGDLLKLMTINLGPFTNDRPVQLLIARTSASADSELILWDTVQGIHPPDSDFYQIGSLTTYHAALTPKLLDRLAAESFDVDQMLPVIVAVVQSYGIYDNLIEMNVGGLVFGVRATGGTVSWLPDTNFVLYDPAFTSKDFVTAIVRDNALIISSSITDDTRVLGHSTSTPHPALWTTEWLQNAKNTLDSGMTPLWIFISTANRVITLIFRSNVNSESKYVRLSNLGEGKFDLAISPDLMQMLTKTLTDKNDGSLPFRLNMLND